MNIINQIYEALFSLKQNKLRSILSGLGVAWGIFILIILLGVGNSFQQGILRLFDVFAQNTLWIYGGQTSEDQNSKYPGGKLISFTQDDINLLKNKFSGIEAISPEATYSGNLLVSNKQNAGYFQIKAVYASYFDIKTIHAEECGRLLNVLDNQQSRKVVLIGRQVADNLFPQTPAVNNYITMGDNCFKVIGIIEKGSLLASDEQNTIYLPYNTFLESFNQGREFKLIMFKLNKETNTSSFEKQLTAWLGWHKGFSEKDKKALFVMNYESQVETFKKLFKGINMFLWFIGLCLLLSGIIGISNIMFMIVKERTFEIGIRKAVGANPKSILGLIITESVMVTTVAGTIGLLLGIAIIKLFNWILESFFTDKDSILTSAGIEMPVILFSLFLLIITGILAGLFPAKKAAEITPVEAIRYEGR